MSERPDETHEGATAQAPQELRAVLANVSSELLDAAGTLREIQDLLAGMGSRTLSATDIVGLQRLDSVEQTIRALGGIVAAASSRTGSDVVVDADGLLVDCCLSTLAARIAGTPLDAVEAMEFF